MKNNTLMVFLNSDNWFGLLSSAAASSKKSNLILTVFFPDADIPWLGSLSYLGPKIIGTDPRLTEANNKSLFPVSVPHTMSYQAQSNLYWAKEGGLQNDFTKLLRYSHKLPEKEASLVKVSVFCLSSLMEFFMFRN